MLDSVKNKAQREGLFGLLTFIVGATTSAGFGFAPKAELDKLHKAEPSFITIDASTKDSEGNVKAVATQEAIDAIAANATTSTSATASKAESKPEPMNFEPVWLDELPPINKGGNKGGDYKFESLEAPKEIDGKIKYAAIFVPATDAKPNPAKSLASTVGSANKRAKNGAKFTVRKKIEDGKITGAYVIREK
jgi:hypothetical protein